MAVKLSEVKVTEAATALNTAVDHGVTLRVRNLSTEDGVDIGGSAVKTTKGWALAKEASDTFELDAGDVLYAVAAAETEVTVAVLST